MPSPFALTLVAILAAAPGIAMAAPCEEQPCTAITHVNVISMVPGTGVETDMTVLLDGGRIAAVGASGTLDLPDGYTEIDGTGRWLIPGLTDMHVHFLSMPIPELDFPPEKVLSPYIAYGVLQILDMAATPATNTIRDVVAAGDTVAPFIASAAMVDGAPAMRPGAREIATVEDAFRVVGEIASEGFDFVKIYSRLDLDAFAAVLDAAASHDIRVIGHIPGGRGTLPEEALAPGFAMVAHAEEFGWRAGEKSDAEIARIVELMAENGTALTTTLLLGERIIAQTRDPSVRADFEGIAMLHPIELMLWFEQNPYVDRAGPDRLANLASVADFSARLVGALAETEVPVFAGTDAAFVPGLAPGLALHEELVAMVDAGMTPREALAAATIAPAQWLGVGEDRGSIAVGKRANLVLLRDNPLEDIAHTRSIDAVVFNGRVFDRPALDDMLAELDALYAPYRPHFSPQATSALAE